MSIKTLVLDHLQNGPITPREALDRYGCFRLAARIYELRKAGNEIITYTVVKNDKRYASYHLIKMAR